MNDKSILLSGLAILALCAMGTQAADPAATVHSAAPVLSARPVDSIEGKLLMPGHGTHPVEFKPGTVRLRMASGNIDLDLAELQSVRYGSAPLAGAPSAAAPAPADASPDTCTIVTVRNDILVGTCPYRDFQRLLKASGPAAPDTKEAPAAITFPGNAPAPTAASGILVLKLDDGSVLHVAPAAKALRLEDSNGAFSLPAALVQSISPAPKDNLLDVRLADAPYAVRSYLPRGDFEATLAPDRTLEFPWKNIVSLSAVSSATAKTGTAKTTQRATATFRDPATRATSTISLPNGFPVTIFSLDTPAGILVIPSTRVLRIARNPDLSCTVTTVAGDILTGKLSLPDLGASISNAPAASVATAAPAAPKASLGTLESIDFEDRAELSLPEDALVWRLASGDVLVAPRDTPETASAPAAPAPKPAAPAVGRIAAVRGPSLVPSTLPQPAADGTWPEKRYTLRPLITAAPLDIPSKQLDTVRFLPVAELPPATIPAGPSAQATDEVVFPGGVFTLGRGHGEGPADETPAVSIQIAPFAMANTPVTVAQFRAFVADTGYSTTAERMSDPLTWKTPGFAQTDDDPVVCVSWLDAVQYCNWRSKRARLAPAYVIRDGGYSATLDPEADGYRLPLEAEWEYAARNGGQDILFPWGTTGIEDESAALPRANFTPVEIPIDPWPHTNPVKALPAAPSGLYGMAGNVWEWCQDMYDAKAYVSAYRVGDIMPLLNPDPRDCPNGIVSRVIRGGSFKNPLSFLRCTTRARGFDQQIGRSHVGMRLARNAD